MRVEKQAIIDEVSETVAGAEFVILTNCIGMTVAEIARIEGTDRRRVWESIRRGLKKLARLLDTAQ